MQAFEEITPNPKIDFSAIKEAVKLFKNHAGTWILASFFILLISLGYVFLMIPFNRVTHASAPTMPALLRLFLPSPTALMPRYPILIPIILAFYITTIFFSAGLYRMATKQVRGQSFSIRDLVRCDRGETISLFIFSIAFWVYHTCIRLVNYHLWYQSTLHPHSPLLLSAFYFGFALQLLIFITVDALLLFTLPLIVDQQMNLIGAISKSFHTLKRQCLMAMLFYIVVRIFAVIGWLLCAIGILVAFPVVTLSVTILYRNFFIGSSSPPAPDKKLFEPAIPPGN